MIFVTRIPTRYNNGKRIPKSIFQSITSEVFDRFGGCTVEGPGTGMWSDDGNVFSEESYRIEVACDRDRYFEARETVIEIGRRLQQLAMYFEVRYFDGVEIIAITQET